MEEKSLRQIRSRIVTSLRQQGFELRGGRIIMSKPLNKDRIRSLHSQAVEHKRAKARKALYPLEEDLLAYIADGSELNPISVSPRLIEVKPKSTEELLFRYASLHWSIPVSSGYGRRLRFIVVDDYNGKLIGIIGLGDPVFSLRDRDEWVGWTFEERKRNLKHVMDAFVLGAVPPYSLLLCGKLVAMLAASRTVQRAFKRKYHGTKAVISGVRTDARLALLTTSSALGRSSIYNRLRFDNHFLYRYVGYTQGSGEFHFSNGLYGLITEYAKVNLVPTAKQELWGSGFRNRREIVKKTLLHLGLSPDLMYHGIRRELYAIPLAKNTREFLKGRHTRLNWYDHSESKMIRYFMERWLLPRCMRDSRYTDWSSRQYRLWS